MARTPTPRGRSLVLLAAAAATLAGCEDGLFGPKIQEQRTLAQLRDATARYKDLDAALDDGFVLLHECEVRPGEGAVGILYVHMDRFLDGELDPKSPDGLLYAPGPGGPELIGVEVALPAAMWSEAEPPEFLGNPLQLEEEFDAWGLHIWLWRDNPDGMYAQAHPGVSCEAEE